MLIPVVDRPCLALVRQCRKKNPLLPCTLSFNYRDCLLHLGCCPRAGPYAAAAFEAASGFGNPLRFPCYLRFAKPRYTERILRWQQRLTFHTFHLLRDYVCLRVYLASISLHFALDFLMESYPHYFNYWPLPFVNYFLFNHILPNFPVTLHYQFFPLWVGCLPFGFHQSPLPQKRATCVFPLWRRCFPLLFLATCATKMCFIGCLEWFCCYLAFFARFGFKIMM